jgi:hypothetical protein
VRLVQTVDVEVGVAEVGLRGADVRDDVGEAERLALHDGQTARAEVAHHQVGQGLILWKPAGAMVRSILQDFLQNELLQRDDWFAQLERC